MHLYQPEPWSCQRSGAALSPSAASPRSSTASSQTASPRCHTEGARCHSSSPITSLPPSLTAPAHHSLKSNLSDQQIPEHAKCPVCQRGLQCKMELVKYINQAKKCTKFHMFPDDDLVTPKTPDMVQKLIFLHLCQHPRVFRTQQTSWRPEVMDRTQKWKCQHHHHQQKMDCRT